MVGLDLFELLTVGTLVLVFVGPERLPQVTRTLGRMIGQFRRAADELRRALMLEADRADEEARLRELVKRRKEAESRRREVVAGAVAQPERVVPEEPQEPSIPAGFTEEEWRELPPHVREIVSRRQAAR